MSRRRREEKKKKKKKIFLAGQFSDPAQTNTNKYKHPTPATLYLLYIGGRSPAGMQMCTRRMAGITANSGPSVPDLDPKYCEARGLGCIRHMTCGGCGVVRIEFMLT